MRIIRSISSALGAAVIALAGLAAVPAEVEAQRGPTCVMEGRQRVCRMGASTRARNAGLRQVRFGNFRRTVDKSCRPGTRPDGKWYLVPCGPGKVCKARCTPVRR